MKCRAVEPLLSEYIDDRLSARQTLEVQRHLADCNGCARTYNELRRTVEFVSASPQLQVSDDFMSGLQSRLEGLEPKPSPSAWIENVRSLFRPRVLPVWGAAAAVAALAVVMLIPSAEVDQVRPAGPRLQEAATTRTASHQNVAISASDPFADIGAANLAAHASADSGGDAEAAF